MVWGDGNDQERKTSRCLDSRGGGDRIPVSQLLELDGLRVSKGGCVQLDSAAGAGEIYGGGLLRESFAVSQKSGPFASGGRALARRERRGAQPGWLCHREEETHRSEDRPLQGGEPAGMPFAPQDKPALRGKERPSSEGGPYRDVWASAVFFRGFEWCAVLGF